ncbi:YecH family metal-binding protein [Shewanella frigidimarina]|uniref:Metal-binding protein n=1 Tax=Shewanella frigidimarina TaxID=56812 RepID=A0A106BYB3_SHEFR|nr:YecH family metal-binding protein [Shewanella frigidimarina]KVX00838.1 metal-binding protein [Shewanella frigidimarina]
MSESVHGHKVMEMMLTHGSALTKHDLKTMMHTEFGAETRYHTCSAIEMDAEMLIEFLEGKGKFIPSNDGIITTADKICNH